LESYVLSLDDRTANINTQGMACTWVMHIPWLLPILKRYTVAPKKDYENKMLISKVRLVHNMVVYKIECHEYRTKKI
jgi:hypothetical protein